MLTIVLVAPFAVGALCAIAFNLVYPRFLAQLQAKHSATWRQLGCPKYLGIRYKPFIATIAFLWRRQYSALNDTRILKLGAYARTAIIGAYVGGGLFAAGGLFTFLLPHLSR
jgi:hypothetical protein